MLRDSPEVGTLWGRVRKPLEAAFRARWARWRQPTLMLSAGLVMMVPAVIAIQVNRLPGEDGASPSARLGIVELGPAMGAVEEAVATAKSADGVVATAWRERALERERAAAAERAAGVFRISPALAEDIKRIATEEGIDPAIGFGLIMVESTFRRTAVSRAGAVGYTQVLPSTARWLVPGTTRSDLFDTQTNLRIGFRYLNYLIDKYNGNVHLALTAYNRGPGTVNRVLRQGRNPDNGYAGRVIRYSRRI